MRVSDASIPPRDYHVAGIGAVRLPVELNRGLNRVLVTPVANGTTPPTPPCPASKQLLTSHRSRLRGATAADRARRARARKDSVESLTLSLLTRKTDTSWPKRVPELTEEQRSIQGDWMRYFHERMPDDHSRVVRFNHKYAARSARPGRTLDIGAGLGEHLRYEDLSLQDYHAVELREDMAKAIRRDFPSVVTVVADCQQRLPYDDSTFDRAVAIHVLEHLPNLPAALSEIRRLLDRAASCRWSFPARAASATAWAVG